MRNLTLITFVLTGWITGRVVLELTDTARALTVVDCAAVRPTKVVLPSRGVYPRYVGQCGWSWSATAWQLALLLLPFTHTLIDPAFSLTRFFRRVVQCAAGGALVGFAVVALLLERSLPASAVDGTFLLDRSPFRLTLVLELGLGGLWLVRAMLDRQPLNEV